MEPKYLSFWRWLYTPIIIWEGDWIPIGFTKTVTGVRQAPMYVVNSDHISPSEFLRKISLRQQKLPNPVHDPHRKKKIKPPNSSNGLIPSSLTPLFAVVKHQGNCSKSERNQKKLGGQKSQTTQKNPWDLNGWNPSFFMGAWTSHPPKLERFQLCVEKNGRWNFRLEWKNSGLGGGFNPSEKY